MEAFSKGNEMERPNLAIFAGAFVANLGALLFVLYDTVVKRRQARLINTAEKSLAIVNSLFPETVRDRLMEKDGQNEPLNRSPADRKESTFVRKDTGRRGGRDQPRIDRSDVGLDGGTNRGSAGLVQLQQESYR